MCVFNFAKTCLWRDTHWHNFPCELLNMFVWSAIETAQWPHRVCEKALALRNISSIVVTLDTFHLEISPLKAWEFSNMPSIVFTLDTSHLEISPLKLYASENIYRIDIARETSHLEISLLKVSTDNIKSIVTTFDTSQSPIGPFGQSPDPFGHALMALTRSLLPTGLKTVTDRIAMQWVTGWESINICEKGQKRQQLHKQT